jgi:hypothetical protein
MRVDLDHEDIAVLRLNGHVPRRLPYARGRSTCVEEGGTFDEIALVKPSHGVDHGGIPLINEASVDHDDRRGARWARRPRAGEAAVDGGRVVLS